MKGTQRVRLNVKSLDRAIDLVLERLKEKNTPLGRVRGISGSCQQHGSVYWGQQANALLAGLRQDSPLVKQLAGAFSHPYAPNWQDHSTQAECDQFDAKLGSAQRLAGATGSSAHHVCSYTLISALDLVCHDSS